MAGTDADGNDCDKFIRVAAEGEIPTFDIAEGATPADVPSRRRCGVRIVGDGLETGGWMVYGDRRPDPPTGSS